MISYAAAMSLMVVMAVKHFLADFLFQTSSVARGKAADRGWLAPLVLHAFGHAVVTLVLALLFFPGTWWVAVAEFAIHAGIDRGKVIVGRRSRLDPTMTHFWWLFGLDQLLHQLTNVAIIGIFLLSNAA